MLPSAAGGVSRLHLVRGTGERLLSVREVAEELGVCTATVYKLCERGELRHVRVLHAIRVSRTDLDAFTAGRRSR